MKTLRILLVEDENIIAVLLADILAEMGHEVCAIEATEAGAVAAAARTRPDLMIVDERLVEGSGVSAVREILLSRFVPHIFVSGDLLSDRSIGPEAVVIQKPYFDGDLVRAIDRAMAGASPA